MKTTLYVGENPKHKIDVTFKKYGRELIHVDDKLVFSNWNLFSRGNRYFTAGNHNVKIKFVGNIYDWSCKVFVDDRLYMHELFPTELETRKIETASLGKFFKVLGIGLITVLFFSFLIGLFKGITGV